MKRSWRVGLGRASNAERDALVQAESFASRLSLECECHRRCVAHDLGLADCSDIAVRYVGLRWKRGRRQLWARIKVRLSTGAEYSYSWAIPVPLRRGRPGSLVRAW